MWCTAFFVPRKVYKTTIAIKLMAESESVMGMINARILNLTIGFATEEQLVLGVFEPNDKGVIMQLNEFVNPPTRQGIENRARDLVQAAIDDIEADSYEDEPDPWNRPLKGYRVLIGGAPWLMGELESGIIAAGGMPVYWFESNLVVPDSSPSYNTVKFVYGN